MKTMMTTVWIALLVIGVATVLASIFVPMMTPAPTLSEPAAILGAGEASAAELLDDLYALDNHGLWTALGIAGGIVAVIGAVPLVVTAVRKNAK